MNFFQHFLELLFPPKCLSCEVLLGQDEPHICLTCETVLGLNNIDNLLQEALKLRFYGKVNFTNAFVCFKYYKGSNAQNLIFAIKYGSQKNAAEWLGYKFGLTIQATDWQNDLPILVPIPLHKSKLIKRGYNQSLHLAIGLSRALGFPVDSTSLIRTEKRSSQTNKERFQRWLNAEHLYNITNNQNILNKHIILVDDVVTTGSTIEACAIELLKAGAAKISIIAMALALKAGQ
ncbi:MAG: ComF family protein [Cytophagales bacterium]|nr:MAG: ComF family protein [Cytophagales bacterium]